MFNGRYIAKPMWLERYGVQPDDILWSFREQEIVSNNGEHSLGFSDNETTFTGSDTDKEKFDKAWMNKLDKIREPIGENTLGITASKLASLEFYRPAKVINEDGELGITFWTAGSYDRQWVHNGNNAAQCIKTAGILTGDKLLKFQSGTDPVVVTKPHDKKWISGTFKQAKLAAAKKEAAAKPLTMWFISDKREIDPKQSEEATGRRRLIALSDRFRRLREFQART